MDWMLQLDGRKRLHIPLLAGFVGVIAFLFLTSHAGQHTASPPSHHHEKSIFEQEYGCGVNVDVSRDQDIVWELPRKKPVGVIVFFHGCHHAAGDLWPPSPTACPHCLGLPEEQQLRQAALRRRLALLAISSLDRIGKRCWAELRSDNGRNVASIIKTWVKEHGLQGLPLFTMGASSGGQMALTLPRHLEVGGVYAQVRGMDDAQVFVLPNGRQYPPTAFVHMPRDAENLAVIQQNIQTLQSAGTRVLEVRIPPRPITVEYLMQRSPLIDKPMAEGVVDALVATGVLLPNGTLTEPPRPVTDRWAPLVQPVIGNLSLVKDESHLGELLNLAWAKHELVSDDAEAVMTWLQSNANSNANRNRKERDKMGIEEARRVAKEEGVQTWGSAGDGSFTTTECKKYSL